MKFVREKNPYDALKIGMEEIRIANKLDKIAKKLGLERVGIEDLNKERAIESWKIPARNGGREGRITLYRDYTDSDKYGVFISGKNGISTFPLRDWDTLEKWKLQIESMYESESFRRGDIRDIMDIGLRYKRNLKKGDLFVVWDKYTKDWELMEVLGSIKDDDNDEINYEDIVFADETPYHENIIFAKRYKGSDLLQASCIWNDDKKRWEFLLQSDIKESLDFKKGNSIKDTLDIGVNILNVSHLEKDSGIEENTETIILDEDTSKYILRNMEKLYNKKEVKDIMVSSTNPPVRILYSINYLIEGPPSYDYIKYKGKFYPIPNKRNRINSI